jgi:hypothetical protein
VAKRRAKGKQTPMKKRLTQTKATKTGGRYKPGKPSKPKS